MAQNKLKGFVAELLASVDVKIDGDRPWDIRVHDERLYRRVASSGNLGLGEAYMDGWWDCEAIDELINRILRGDLAKKVRQDIGMDLVIYTLLHFNPAGHKNKAFEIAEKHYNTGNDLFQAMLDKRMVYTCGYWRDAQTLDEAQEAKLDLVCRKIGLKQGMRVLDIGGGWGSFAKFAAEKYGASVVNVTVSKEQVELANKLCKGLTVENRLQDYRDVNEKFDAIVSLGMFEHVGPRYYKDYFAVVERCLKDDGLFLLHTIGRNETKGQPDAWISKYIFPNSALPSMHQITGAVERHFIVEDWHNFSADYDKTLMAWYKNFEQHWPELKTKYSERFYRMWRYYLLSCAGGFRARGIQLWQIVLSKKGVVGGYESVR
ncbi:MAG: cyclopropane fatty acyl phospholipid synthase [bacterium]|nr:cyclopropane fatty acyl phospholipid synthase [bacterium]